MPVDYDDLETDNADVEKKVYEVSDETSETSIDLDFKSNIQLAEDSLNKNLKEEKMLPEKTADELETLMAKISLTEELDNSEKSDDENADDPEEIISRAPVGGIPVTYADSYIGLKALKNGPAFDPSYNNMINAYPYDGKPKRGYNESEFHAVKYRKPTDNDSLLLMQCATLPEFMSQNVIINSQQPSGGMVTINKSPSLGSNEEYDSSFSPGESNYDSPPPARVLSPASDYSSMANSPFDPSYSELNLDLDIKPEISLDDLETKLSDVTEIIEKDLIKEEKKRLEKVLFEDNFEAYSPPQYVPGQGSAPSSSPPSLYNNALSDIIGDLRSAETASSSQLNQPALNQQMVYPHQQLYSPQPPIQQHQPNMLNSNSCQYPQLQQQQPLMNGQNHLAYNLPAQTNGLSNTPPQQNYHVQQIPTTTGSQTQYVVQNPQVNNRTQQPIISPSRLGYPQPNPATPVTTQHFVPQRQAPMTQNTKQYSVAPQSVSSNQQHYIQPDTQITSLPKYSVQPGSHIITTTSNQPFLLNQHQNVVAPKHQYTNSPPQQRVTVSAIRTPQTAVPQLTQLVQKPAGTTPVVTAKTAVLPTTTAPDQNGIHTTTTTASSNNAVIILAQSPNAQNPIVLVPIMSQIPKPKTIRPAPRQILPKPANGDPNANRVDLTKLPTQTAKGRQSKDKSSQPGEMPGQGNLGVARRCVAAMRDEHLENTSDEGDNYLHVAVCKTDVYMIEALLERLHRSGKLDLIDKQNYARQTPVYLAVSANQPAMVHKLIRYGADVNIKGMMHGYQNEKVERAPIHCAASKGKEYFDTLKELFKSDKIDPDVLNSDGLSALHCAIIEHGKLVPNARLMKIDNCQNVTLLLKHKANPNFPDRCNGKTPLMYAIESKDYTIVETILKTVESSKIPELLSARTFDGRTCEKIADGLRNEYDPQTWRKLNSLFSNVH